MKVLMVSTEYPPMRGGVGRYSANLVQALRKTGDGIEVDVVWAKPVIVSTRPASTRGQICFIMKESPVTQEAFDT